MKRIWIVLLLLGLLSIGWGVSRSQHMAVRRWAETICTSCIGLTPKESPPQ